MMRAVVTGASVGIGAATARALARDGYDVAVHYHRHATEAARVVESVRSLGREAFAVEADLADPSGPGRLVAQLDDRWNSLDALVHNAGEYPRVAFDQLDGADVDRCFRVNVFAPLALTQQLLPRLRAAGSARVVFVSSVLALSGSTHGAHYAAAKAALLGLARSLARELAPTISVNVVAPGSIDTAILEGDSPEKRKQREHDIPLGRVGRPEEVAEAIAYLVSGRASYVTGATLHVNGGLRPE